VKQELPAKGRKKIGRRNHVFEHDGGRICFPKPPLLVMWTDASAERLVAAQRPRPLRLARLEYSCNERLLKPVEPLILFFYENYSFIHCQK
jgi:hypothetical protein